MLLMQIWDFSSHLNALAEAETNVSKDASIVSTQTPLVKFTGHKDEGYAIDWSPLVPGRLVSGMKYEVRERQRERCYLKYRFCLMLCLTNLCFER